MRATLAILSHDPKRGEGIHIEGGRCGNRHPRQATTANPESQPRWDRFERAGSFFNTELRTQGSSERQAAKELKVPRTTLQAWRMWHDDSRYLSPTSLTPNRVGPGLAFLHRLVIAFHMVCVEVGGLWHSLGVSLPSSDRS